MQIVAVLAVHAALLLFFFGHAATDVQTAAAITLVTSVGRAHAAVRTGGPPGPSALRAVQRPATGAAGPLRGRGAVRVGQRTPRHHDDRGRLHGGDGRRGGDDGGVRVARVRRRSPMRAGADTTPTVKDLVRFGSKGLLGSASPLETFRLDQAVVGLFLAPAALGSLRQRGRVHEPPEVRGAEHRDGRLSQDRRRARRAQATSGHDALHAPGLRVCARASVAALIVGVPRLLPFFFGEEFEGAVGVARVLLVGGLFIGMRRVLSDGARGIGRPGAGTMAEAVSWVVLIPALAFGLQFGILGVAWALTASAATSVAALARDASRSAADASVAPATGEGLDAARGGATRGRGRRRDARRCRRGELPRLAGPEPYGTRRALRACRSRWRRSRIA